jgi:gas vesicle protein
MNGFTLGMLAGAGGYFLFATDHGRKVRQQIAQEWTDAKKQLVKDGVISSADISLREFIQEVFSKASGQPATELEKDAKRGMALINHEVDQVKKVVKTIAKAPARKTATTRKFKGV